LGAISLSNSNHFPLRLYSYDVNPVVFPPGRAKPSANRIADICEPDRHTVSNPLQCNHAGTAGGKDNVRRQRDRERRTKLENKIAKYQAKREAQRQALVRPLPWSTPVYDRFT
jgi:hypothetical protein